MRRLRLGVLISGGGRSLENFFAGVESGELPAEVAAVVSSHPGVAGLERARRRGLEPVVVDHREAGEEFSGRIAEILRAARVELVAMAGFIRRWAIPGEFRGRVMNIHPALLPAFGGKGFYGERVHRAVLESGVRFSGCTVHYVDEEYDRGPIILQRVVPVLPGDTEQQLAERVFREECIAYPEAIRLHAAGRLKVERGRVMILNSESLA